MPIALGIKDRRPGGAFLDGQNNAFRNALNERQMVNSEASQAAQQQNMLFQQQRQTRADEASAAQAAEAGQQDERTQLYNYLAHLSKVRENPQVFEGTKQRMLQSPLFQKYGIGPEDLTPDEIDQALPAFAAEAGVAPAAEPDKWEQVSGPRGSVMARNARTGEMKQIVGPDNTESVRSAGGYRAMSPQEIAAAGLPPGTSAQLGPDGKIDVLSKRDNTGVLSQKDATTAKMKLNTVALARQQLNKIKQAFEEGRSGGLNAFGPGQGYLPTEAGKKFDARVNQMRSTLTALTRVPGVGAMSDYETKLDQSKFPSRTAYESVTADTLQSLEDQLSLIENRYRDLLSGGATEATQPVPQASAPRRIRVDAQGNVIP